MKEDDLDRLRAWASGEEREAKQGRGGRKNARPGKSGNSKPSKASRAPGSNKKSGGNRPGGNKSRGSLSKSGVKRNQPLQTEAERAEFRRFVAQSRKKVYDISLDEAKRQARKRKRRVSSAAESWAEWRDLHHGAPLPDRVLWLKDYRDSTFHPSPLLNEQDDVPDDRYFFVGIDAGTSGIRVALRDEFSQETRLFDYGENPVGATRFSFPTAVAVLDGTFVFGSTAVQASPEQRFVSFKAALVHPEVEAELLKRWRSLALPAPPESAAAIPSPSDLLYSVSVARALELSLQQLTERGQATNGRPASYSFAVGAPVDGTPQVSERFHRALATAVLLCGQIGPRPPIKKVLGSYAAAWEAAGPVCAAAPEEQRLFLKSEAYSAIRGLQKFKQSGNNFLIVDIGATTTELSLIRVGTDLLACYAACSIPVGVDYADRASLRGVRDDVLKARLRRHSSGGSPGDGASAKALEKLAEEIRRHLGGVLRAAIRKNEDPPSWKDLYVILAGGGSNVTELARVFREDPIPHNWVKRRFNLSPMLSEAVVVGASNRSIQDNELFELPSVLGTASPAWEDEETVGPDEVETVVPIYESPTREHDEVRKLRWV